MIETLNIIKGIYDEEVTEGVFKMESNSLTRGNVYTLKTYYCTLNINTYSFTNRVVDISNNLPNEVVSAKNDKQFEIQLDIFWENQSVK